MMHEWSKLEVSLSIVGRSTFTGGVRLGRADTRLSLQFGTFLRIGPVSLFFLNLDFFKVLTNLANGGMSYWSVLTTDL